MHRASSLLALCLIIFVCAWRAPAAVVDATYHGAADVPVTAAGYTATGNTVNFSLQFAPATGATLMVVKNTALPFINGTFDNLAQGQGVTLVFNGQNYRFVANYYGGSGNDLVLVWAGNRPVTWGPNDYGQLGNGTTAPSSLPGAVDTSGVLAGKTIVALSAGGFHCMALCADGTLATWGDNAYGELGNNSTVNSLVPIAVPMTGVLQGKRVVSVAAGYYSSAALCSDGTVAAWGSNYSGELGSNSGDYSHVPVAVDRTGALAGKSVVALAAGAQHIVALCSDGRLVAWGSGGLLGNNSDATSNVPVAVDASGVLAGKTVTAIATGEADSLALCSDGTVASWGLNDFWQLGDNTFVSVRRVPVAVYSGGVLAGRTVTAIAAGGFHSLALCSDGSVAAWGAGSYGQNGVGGSVPAPVLMTTAAGVSALSQKTVIGVTGEHDVSMAVCSDGTAAAWGDGEYGQIGNNSLQQNNYAPVAVSISTLGSGECFVKTAPSPTINFALALVAAPLAANASTLAAGNVTGASATLNGFVLPGAGSAAVSFEFGTDTTYGATLAGTPPTVTDSNGAAVSAPVTGLQAGVAYHFRVKAVIGSNTYFGQDVAFVTLGPLALWRLDKFGTSEPAGNAADDADPNKNGVANLLEYALHGEPVAAGGGLSYLPQYSASGDGRLQLTFTHYLDRTDVTYYVEAADTPDGAYLYLATSSGGNIFSLIDTGGTLSETGTSSTRTVTVGDRCLMTNPAHPARFLRLRVTHP